MPTRMCRNRIIGTQTGRYNIKRILPLRMGAPIWYKSGASNPLHIRIMRFLSLMLFSLSMFCFPLSARGEDDDRMGDFMVEESDATGSAAGATEGFDAEPERVTAPEEEHDASDDTAAEALVATLKTRFAALAELLARVQDAESAESLQSEVRDRFAMLLTTDAAALADADEEELAAEFAEAFAPIDAELARLEELDFFGCEELRMVFADGEEANENEAPGYVFPLGPLDFMRGNKSQERHVCPRHEGGLQLLDWSQE